MNVVGLKRDALPLELGQLWRVARRQVSVAHIVDEEDQQIRPPRRRQHVCAGVRRYLAGVSRPHEKEP